MRSADVYEQYFAGECVYADVPRRGVKIALTAESDAGEIRYLLTVSFFPHRDAEDFGISYDACRTETLYAAKGRRSRKREAQLMESLRARADALAAELNGTIGWESPLIGARLG